MKTKIKELVSFKTLVILFIFACFAVMLPFTQNLIINFAQNTIGRNLRSITKWSLVITHTSAFFATFAIALYFLKYISHGKIIASDIISTAKQTFKNKKQSATLIIFAAVLIFVAYSSIILANYDYTDDIRRSFTGHKMWIGATRIVSESLAVFLHTNFYINDIWPLTHFISIFILALTSYLLAYIGTDGKVSLLSILAAVLFSISPYFATCMSFKFDSPYMCFSVFVTVLPFLFRKDLKTFCFVSFLALLLSCTSYQAAQSVYIMLAIFVVLKKYLAGESQKEMSSFAAASILAYVFSLVFFQFVICIPRAWNAESENFEALSIISLPHNLVSYSKAVLSNYGNIWIKFFTALSVLFFPFAAMSQSKKSRITTFTLSVVAFLLMLALSYGAYLVLQKILLSGRAFMGFNIFVALVAIMDVTAFSNMKKMRICSIGILACLFWGLCVNTVSIGTFYHKYKEYTRFRFNVLMQDLNEIVDQNAHNSLYYGNTIEIPESARMVLKNYHIDRFSLSTNQTQYLLKGYDMDFEILNEDFIEDIHDKELVKKLTDLPLIKDTYYHTIYGKDNQYFVEFKNPKPQEN